MNKFMQALRRFNDFVQQLGPFETCLVWLLMFLALAAIVVPILNYFGL